MRKKMQQRVDAQLAHQCGTKNPVQRTRKAVQKAGKGKTDQKQGNGRNQWLKTSPENQKGRNRSCSLL
nr:hypothetical protein [uncultured Cohaesibacter sp.]